MERDLRESVWYPFTAPGELFVENSNQAQTTRLIELSREGCYLVLGNPLPPGTAVLVRVYAWPHFFQVRGAVCYTDNHFGVGVTFLEIGADEHRVLELCLREAGEQERRDKP
jgi:hypothetical protein